MNFIFLARNNLPAFRKHSAKRFARWLTAINKRADNKRNRGVPPYSGKQKVSVNIMRQLEPGNRLGGKIKQTGGSFFYCDAAIVYHRFRFKKGSYRQQPEALNSDASLLAMLTLWLELRLLARQRLRKRLTFDARVENH